LLLNDTLCDVRQWALSSRVDLCHQQSVYWFGHTNIKTAPECRSQMFPFQWRRVPRSFVITGAVEWWRVHPDRDDVSQSVQANLAFCLKPLSQCVQAILPCCLKPLSQCVQAILPCCLKPLSQCVQAILTCCPRSLSQRVQAILPCCPNPLSQCVQAIVTCFPKPVQICQQAVSFPFSSSCSS
jgi:hypothetical protein